MKISKDRPVSTSLTLVSAADEAAQPDDDASGRKIVRAFVYRLAADVERVAECINTPEERVHTKLLETLIAVESGEKLETVVNSLDSYFRGSTRSPA